MQYDQGEADRLFAGSKPNFTWVKEIFYRDPCPHGLTELKCLLQAEDSPFPREYHYQDWVYFQECPACGASKFNVLNGVKCVIRKTLSLVLFGIQCPSCKAIMSFYDSGEESLLEKSKRERWAKTSIDNNRKRNWGRGE